MSGELPRCAVCRVSIEAGQSVVFRLDGRVQHVTCPTVTCHVCLRTVEPTDPIRRDGPHLVHGNCWMRLRRQAHRAGATPGGSESHLPLDGPQRQRPAV